MYAFSDRFSVDARPKRIKMHAFSNERRGLNHREQRSEKCTVSRIKNFVETLK